MSRPQQKPNPRSQATRSGLKVVEDDAPAAPAVAAGQPGTSAQPDRVAEAGRAADAAARKRLHPARVWPD